MSYPFSANGKIEKSELFVGRQYEMDFLVSRMLNIPRTCINIFGEPSVGKSSLLYHFYSTWSQRMLPSEKDKCVVIYLSLQEAAHYREGDFYRQVAAEFRNAVKDTPALVETWRVTHWDHDIFAEILAQWRMQNILPVLCVDDIEKAFENRRVFNEYFFDNLSKLLNDKKMILIVASTQPLCNYKVKYGFNSAFFNPTHNIHLQLFLEAETAELLSLGGILSRSERKLAQYWGQGHPYKLQLAALSLCEARQYHESEKWAKLRFDAQLRTLYHRGLPKYIQWLDVRLERLRPLNKWLGETCNRLHPVMAGSVVIAVAFFLLEFASEEAFEFLVKQVLEFLLKIWRAVFGN